MDMDKVTSFGSLEDLVQKPSEVIIFYNVITVTEFSILLHHFIQDKDICSVVGRKIAVELVLNLLNLHIICQN